LDRFGFCGLKGTFFPIDTPHRRQPATSSSPIARRVASPVPGAASRFPTVPPTQSPGAASACLVTAGQPRACQSMATAGQLRARQLPILETVVLKRGSVGGAGEVQDRVRRPESGARIRYLGLVQEVSTFELVSPCLFQHPIVK
jgi:hypothetical protein